MTLEEAKHALDELKAQGETDESILKTLYLMYTHDKMTLDDLRIFTELLGYKFTDEFEAMSDEDKKTKGLTQEDEAAEGVDKEEVEDAKEYTEGEKKADDESKDDDDDKRAARLFGFNK